MEMVCVAGEDLRREIRSVRMNLKSIENDRSSSDIYREFANFVF